VYRVASHLLRFPMFCSALVNTITRKQRSHVVSASTEQGLAVSSCGALWGKWTKHDDKPCEVLCFLYQVHSSCASSPESLSTKQKQNVRSSDVPYTSFTLMDSITDTNNAIETVIQRTMDNAAVMLYCEYSWNRWRTVIITRGYSNSTKEYKMWPGLSFSRTSTG
jgi:hypothetical protein